MRGTTDVQANHPLSYFSRSIHEFTVLNSHVLFRIGSSVGLLFCSVSLLGR